MSPHRVVDSSSSTGFGILVFTLNILRRGLKRGGVLYAEMQDLRSRVAPGPGTYWNHTTAVLY